MTFIVNHRTVPLIDRTVPLIDRTVPLIDLSPVILYNTICFTIII